MKKVSFLLLLSLLLAACENPFMIQILEPKTIYFESNGGSPVQSQALLRGQAVKRPNNPVRDSFDFDGWFKDNDTFLSEWDFDEIPTEDVTLYAKWIENGEITVTFSKNGGDTDASPVVITVEAGSLITPPETEPTRDSFDFDGWYRDADCVAIWDFAADTVTASIILYAKWTPQPGVETRTVTFNKNGGDIEASPLSRTVVYSRQIPAPETPPARTGHTFVGWYKEADCINEWDFAADTVTEDITLYAKWEINRYTVTFNANDGTPAPDKQTIDYGGRVTQPAAMTLEYFIFAGWYKEAGCINKWDFETDTVTEDITLYAKWTSIPPEGRPAAGRWYTWTEPTSTAAVDYSVADDGVCTIIVGGTPDQTRWHATASYEYTADEKASYVYEFEAWTASGDRTLNFQYYNDWDRENGGTGEILNINNFTIDSTRRTYTTTGQQIPKNRICSLEFQCADKTGTFYVKILRIYKITGNTALDDLPYAQRWYTWVADDSKATVGYFYVDDDVDGVCAIIVDGSDPDIWKAHAGYNYTTKTNTRYTYEFEAWTESGSREINIQYYWDNDTNHGLQQNNFKLTETKKTYTILGDIIPKGGVSGLAFQCADQWGTFYVRNISITEVETVAVATALDFYAQVEAFANYAGDTTIYVSADLTLNRMVSIPANSGRTLTIKSSGARRALTRGSTTGYLFDITDSTLIFENIVIDGGGSGSSSNTGALVSLTFPANFEMREGAVLQNNRSASGGGVIVYDGGTFTMNGGEISGNTAEDGDGGGVYVDGGTFTMNGGTISDNWTNEVGGGVFVYSGGTFTMSGSAKVLRNEASQGGGVGVYGGAFTMSGGTVSNNESTSNGGGVSVLVGGTFNMNSGIISNNGGTSDGGGVYVSGTFTMSGSAVISGNKADSFGGGVLVSGGTFTMSGGTVSDNEAINALGGGVAVYSGMYVNGSTFTMSGSASVSDNKAISGTGTFASGGGVYITGANSTFTMSGNAKVSGNKTENSSTFSSCSAGGVYVGSGGTFIMNGGTIGGEGTPNTAYDGGGVVVGSGSTFTMTGGEVSYNEGIRDWAGFVGGVYVDGGTFNMEGGEVSFNKNVEGGGVRVWDGGTFNMSGSAKVSYNTAYKNGGGVLADGNNSTFNMTGGEIKGNKATGSSPDGNGGGVMVADSGKFRISTGIVHGTGAVNDMANSATNDGAALYVKGGSATAQCGTFDNGGVWNPTDNLWTSNTTITVTNGNLQQ